MEQGKKLSPRYSRREPAGAFSVQASAVDTDLSEAASFPTTAEELQKKYRFKSPRHKEPEWMANASFSPTGTKTTFKLTSPTSRLLQKGTMALPGHAEGSPEEDAAAEAVPGHRESPRRHYQEIEKVKNFGKASQKM